MVQYYRGTFLVCLTTILGASAPTSGDDPVLRARLLAEYPAAAARLRDAYSHIRGTCVETVEETRAGKSTRTSSSLDLFLDGEYHKLVYRNERSTSNLMAFSRTTCLTPGLGFQVVVEKQGSPPIIKVLERSDSRRVSLVMNEFRDRCIYSPFTAILPIDQLLIDSRVKLGDVSSLRRDGKDLVQVRYTREANAGKRKISVDETILLSPLDSWALIEHHATANASETLCQLEYGKSEAGIPSLKRVFFKTDRSTKTLEFQDLHFGTTPKSEFTLEAAGIAGVEEPAVVRTNRTPYYFVFGGGVLGVLAFVIRIQNRRNKSHEP